MGLHFLQFQFSEQFGAQYGTKPQELIITTYGASYLHYSYSPTPSDMKHIHYSHSLFQSCKGVKCQVYELTLFLLLLFY